MSTDRGAKPAGEVPWAAANRPTWREVLAEHRRRKGRGMHPSSSPASGPVGA